MPSSFELRVLHWNVHSWLDESGRSNVDRVADLVAKTSADVVSLVEVDEPVDGPSSLDGLAAALSFNSIFVPAFEYGDDQPCGRFGNALLTRLPVLDVRHLALLWPPTRFDSSEPSEPRSVVLGRVESQIGPVWVGSTHLPRADSKARADALRRAVSAVSRLPAPWLLMGDFNVAASEWCHEYPDLRSSPLDPVPTHPAGNAVECIDYCVAPAGQQIQADVLSVSGSDHLPVLARLLA